MKNVSLAWFVLATFSEVKNFLAPNQSQEKAQPDSSRHIIDADIFNGGTMTDKRRTREQQEGDGILILSVLELIALMVITTIAILTK